VAHLMAYPTKLTPETHAKIVGLLRHGNYLETAAAAAGISSRSIRNWIKKGAKGEEPYATFAADVEQAIAEGEALDVVKMAQLARGTKEHAPDMRALSWRLERRHRERWGAKLTIVTEAREQAVGEVLGRIREIVDASTWQRILMGLSDPADGSEPERVEH